MIVILVILLVAVIGGVAAYVIMQYTGVLSGIPDQAPRLSSDGWTTTGGSGIVDRIQAAPQGCLITAIVAMALWIAAWAVVLILGLRVLLA